MSFLFWLCAVIAILTGIGVVASRHPVHSVVGLIVNFSALAVLFLTLSGEFLAMIQIIIYAGAILVLFLFVIAILTAGNRAVESAPSRLEFQAVPSIVAGLAALTLLAAGIRETRPAAAITSPPPEGFGLVATFGRSLLTTNLFAFEVTGFVLLVAVIGVIVMAGRPAVRS